ncbi:MAG: membrane protein insertion efficiency factor YidD [Acidobacteria bacterium]|nr:membrane protein insertion efficiency factor YidD [Acidobacteriota bacterium]
MIGARTATSAAARAVTSATTPPATQAERRARRRQRRARAAVPLVLLAVLLAFDLSRPPASQLSARLLLGGIHLYQATLSPRLGAWGVRCRFRPTCSHYAAGAIARYGALSGSLRAAWRVARCGPWTPQGTDDPP